MCSMDKPRVVHGNVIPMGIPWETSHGMGWGRHKLLWDGNGTEKYVPWTTLLCPSPGKNSFDALARDTRGTKIAEWQMNGTRQILIVSDQCK